MKSSGNGPAEPGEEPAMDGWAIDTREANADRLQRRGALQGGTGRDGPRYKPRLSKSPLSRTEKFSLGSVITHLQRIRRPCHGAGEDAPAAIVQPGRGAGSTTVNPQVVGHICKGPSR